MPLDLSGYSFSAIIFDCDGTLADTEPLHYEAYRRALFEQGHELHRPWFSERTGLSRDQLLQTYMRSFGCTLNLGSAARVSKRVFATLVGQVREISAVADVARQYSGSVPMAVASGGQRELVDRTLAACGLLELFDEIITVEDTGVGKPSPALFLEAAHRLNVLPHSCLVFEDTNEGVEAARRAGMAFIDVRKFRGQMQPAK